MADCGTGMLALGYHIASLDELAMLYTGYSSRLTGKYKFVEKGLVNCAWQGAVQLGACDHTYLIHITPSSCPFPRKMRNMARKSIGEPTKYSAPHYHLPIVRLSRNLRYFQCVSVISPLAI